MENKVIVKIVVTIIVVVAIAAAAKIYMDRHNAGQSGLPAQPVGALTAEPAKGVPQQEVVNQPN